MTQYQCFGKRKEKVEKWLKLQRKSQRLSITDVNASFLKEKGIDFFSLKYYINLRQRREEKYCLRLHQQVIEKPFINMKPCLQKKRVMNVNWIEKLC